MSDAEKETTPVQHEEAKEVAKTMKDWKDPDQAELEKRMCEDINKMPAEVQDRFKAIYVGYNLVDQISEEEQIAQRQLELKYEKLYQ